MTNGKVNSDADAQQTESASLALDGDRNAPGNLAGGTNIIRHFLKTLPNTPGVYRMLGADGGVLYVGKAGNLRKRVATYTQAFRLPVRLQRMVAETTDMEFLTTSSEVEALLLEANLIKKLRPRFNVLLRDDKSFPHILLASDHPYARLTKHRGARSKPGDYFGPFASAGSVNRTITALQKAFLIRNCSDSVFASRTRPCLQYQIKRCTAPCVARVDEESYRAQVDQARRFLQGRSREVKETFLKEMLAASDRLDFESAARYRDRLRALTAIQAHQDINLEELGDADVVAAYQEGGQTCIEVYFLRGGRNCGNRSYYPSHDKNLAEPEVLSAFLVQFYENKPAPNLVLLSHTPPERRLIAEALTLKSGHKVELAVPKRGDRRRPVDHALANAREALGRKRAEASSQAALLAGVADAFGLGESPSRIEVYDNSHIQGTNAIGAMIVAGPEGFIKAAYRKFTIRSPEAMGDDFAMMREVLTRRFARILREDPGRESSVWPDLVLIDGGQGQLTVAVEVLAELGIDDVSLVAIAKGPDRNAGRERFFLPNQEPFSLEDRNPVLYYLQRLRDEAHRFAIGTHRARRSKQLGQSEVDQIEGIGPARKKALLHHFGSARAIARAGLVDLEEVDGISKAVARRIYDHFHPEA